MCGVWRYPRFQASGGGGPGGSPEGSLAGKGAAVSTGVEGGWPLVKWSQTKELRSLGSIACSMSFVRCLLNKHWLSTCSMMGEARMGCAGRPLSWGFRRDRAKSRNHTIPHGGEAHGAGEVASLRCKGNVAVGQLGRAGVRQSLGACCRDWRSRGGLGDSASSKVPRSRSPGVRGHWSSRPTSLPTPLTPCFVAETSPSFVPFCFPFQFCG